MVRCADCGFLCYKEKERECDGFVSWNPGFTPKEHKEMDLDLKKKKLEIDQKRWDKLSDRSWTIVVALVSALIGWFLHSSSQKENPIIINVPAEKLATPPIKN